MSKNKKFWQMTEEELRDNPLFIITDEITGVAQTITKKGVYKIALHPVKFFELPEEGKKWTIKHEMGHIKTNLVLSKDLFWKIVDSNLFGRYDVEKKEWIPKKGFYGRNVKEALANAIVMYEEDPAKFTKEHPKQTPLIEALSEGKSVSVGLIENPITKYLKGGNTMVKHLKSAEEMKKPWEMTREEFDKRYEHCIVVGNILYTGIGEPIKIGDKIVLQFAGYPVNMPQPWKLVGAKNYFTTVSYKNKVNITVEAANKKRMSFDNACLYSPSGTENKKYFDKFLKNPLQNNAHASLVKQAFKEGKSIPAIVLRDYPELKKK